MVAKHLVVIAWGVRRHSGSMLRDGLGRKVARTEVMRRTVGYVVTVAGMVHLFTQLFLALQFVESSFICQFPLDLVQGDAIPFAATAAS